MGTKGRRLCAQPFRSCSSRRVVEVPLARPDAPATMQGDAAGAQARPVLFGNAAWKRAAESRLFFSRGFLYWVRGAARARHHDAVSSPFDGWPGAARILRA